MLTAYHDCSDTNLWAEANEWRETSGIFGCFEENVEEGLL